MKILVEISARHVHLSEKDAEKLFGKNYRLNSIKKISQPGEFASDKTITLINGKNKIEHVRVVGPERKNSQAEISLTDAYHLKLNPIPKIKISGDLTGTIQIIVKGPKNSIKIQCIIAQRHLHCSEIDAKKLKLKNKQNIKLKIQGKRGLIFDNIAVRVSPYFKTAVHLDTDEGNSAGIKGKTFGKILKI